MPEREIRNRLDLIIVLLLVLIVIELYPVLPYLLGFAGVLVVVVGVGLTIRDLLRS